MTTVHKNKPILYDPLIIPRVKQYLEENVHQTYVDVAVMARQLQERYREYSRRKSAPFRVLVEQAYKTVLHSYGLDSNPSTDNEVEANSDVEMMDDPNISNHMNEMLTNMYTKNSGKKSAAGGEGGGGELIDISSDESDTDFGKSKDKTNSNKKSADKILHKSTTISKVTNNNTNSTTAPAVSVDANKKVVVASFAPIPALAPLGQISKKRRLDNHHNQDGSKSSVSVPTKITHPTTASVSDQPSNSLNINLKRRYKKEVQLKHSTSQFRDVGGMDKILKELCEIIWHIKHPEIYHQMGIDPPKGILLHGPPGCGKTLLANAIAGELKYCIMEIPATELIAGVSGESEERIREVFEQAIAFAPCVLFIDDIEAISSNRLNAQKDMERRIVAQLISCLDNLVKHENGDQVVIIGATTRPETLDPALRRVNRFDNEISLGIPDRDEREEILIVISEILSLEVPFDFRKIAELTPGYVGADLLSLINKAASVAIKRCIEQGYRLQQAKLAKNIPIVNLIDESATVDDKAIEKDADIEVEKIDDGEINTNNSTITETIEDEIIVDDKENQELNGKTDFTDAPTKESDDKDKDKDKEKDKGITDKNEKSDQDKTADKDKNDTSLEKGKKNDTDEDTATEITTNNKDAEKTNQNEDETTNMDVDANTKENLTKETPKNTKTVTNVATGKDVEETEIENIDDEEIEVQDKGSNIAADDVTIDLDELPDAPKEGRLSKRRQMNPSLFELMGWLSSDTSPMSLMNLSDLYITVDDFQEALKLITPAAKREGFITVPDVTWSDIGSMNEIREELQLAILAPVKFPEKLKVLGLGIPSGVLLCGPPGCGKTLIAKAIANEAGINFISVKGPELMNMYVGESEKAVRQCFQRAKNSAPCVIFFDEFDSLCPKRSDIGDGGSGTRVVNQLLTEMDGVEERKGVYLMAATNRPDIIDPAVLRPGRLDKVLYVGLPNADDRVEILEALTKKRTKPVLEDDVCLKEIAQLTNGYTGADLAGLIRQASLLALKNSISDPTIKNEDLKVNKDQFIAALKLTKPSVSLEDQKIYQKLKTIYATSQKSSDA